MTKGKKTNNDLQNTTQKTTDRATQASQDTCSTFYKTPVLLSTRHLFYFLF